MNAIKQTPKYKRDHPMQLSRFRQLLIMLVRCMLPIVLVERQPFRKFVETLDPSFHMPSRYVVKKTGLPQLRDEIKIKILNGLKSIPWPNIILDGWSDGIMRCFTGYIVQGIDDSWNLVRYTLAFRLTKGKIKKYVNFFYFEYKFGLILQGSHTGTSIKRQYYQILDDYKIETVYKIVADQAANMKKAFVDEQEGVDKNSKPEDFYLITAQNLLIE
jgi:hypothetical protein